MTVHVLMAGSDWLTMAEADTIAKAFSQCGSVIRRHPIDGINWGAFVPDLGKSTHLFLVLRGHEDATISERDQKNVREIINLLAVGETADDIQIGVLFQSEKAVEQYRWILEEGPVELAFTMSPVAKSKVPSSCRRSILTPSLTRSSCADEIARALVGEKVAREVAA